MQDLGVMAKEFARFDNADYLGEKLVVRQEPETDFLSAHELRCIKLFPSF